jgi:asparagine synthase (glutamine-hydrolysing)
MNTQSEMELVNDESNPIEGLRVLMWDGRIDNRSDLLLLLKDYLRGDLSNSALAFAAYKRWGTSGFVHLIGDWSVVIHDDDHKTTVLASDFAGVRPLYYAVKSGQVLWSSRLWSLVEATGISDLDEQYLGAFLLYGGCPNRTPYKGIYSVPAGHAVCVSAGGTKISRFWSLPVHDEVRYRSQHRYEEHLRALFREAVSVRLQRKAPVLAELSGGLDSSSVVSMAYHLMRSGTVPATSLTSVSYVWRDSLDEPFIREMESFCDIKGIHISTHDTPLIGETEVGLAQPEILQPLRKSVALLSRCLEAKVLLTGLNGDLMMGNWFDDSLQVAASLRRFRIAQTCKDALEWSKILRLPVYQTLWQALRASLPPPLTPRAVYAREDGSYTVKNTETSLMPRLVDRLGISESRDIFSDTWMQALPERRKYFRSLSTTLELRSLQVPELWQHLDYTHPFAHRPLVEFLMTVPTDVLCRPGEPRKLMRSALSDLWPIKLQNRRSKGLFNAPWQEALRPLADMLLGAKRLNVVDLGFVDHKSVLSRLQRLSLGVECNHSQLRNIVILELWLRIRDSSGFAYKSNSILDRFAVQNAKQKGGEYDAEKIHSS